HTETAMAKKSKAKRRTARPAKAKAPRKAARKVAKRAKSRAKADHVALPGSTRPCIHAQRVRDVDPGAPVEVTIEIRGPALPDELPAHALTREEYESKFSASREDADKVARVLEKYGIRVVDVSLPGRSLRASGTAAEMEAAFHPGLGIYETPQQGEYRGREGS